MRSKANTDNGYYNENGIYVTLNGTENQGLACPKGVRLYSPAQPAIFFQPTDIAKGETFEIIRSSVAPDILPYYAVSNYGRVMNIRSGKVMKENYRSGYGYFCLCADNSKFGQKKYSTHRLVLETFDPKDDMKNLQVNHIDGNKKNNFVNKIMEDGTIQSNLEWVTPKENIDHSVSVLGRNCTTKISDEDVLEIRDLYNKGYSISQIMQVKKYNIGYTAIQSVCVNRTHTDPNYMPRTYKDYYNMIPNSTHILSNKDAEIIRSLSKSGYTNKDIKEKFYNDFSESTISDIVRGVSHTEKDNQ